MGAKAFPGNLYDGHTYDGETGVYADKHRRGRTLRSFWKWMKRWATIGPSVGHLKHGHRIDRNRLEGEEGERINAVLKAAGRAFIKLRRYLAVTYLRHYYGWVFWL